MEKVLDCIGKYRGRLVSFVRESKAELKKVSWPTRKQVGYSTLVVVLLTIALSAYLGILDLFLTKLVSSILG
ncbi:MAG: preprotein translocase subunit SecE [Synergistaceae bacterium]|jgi:preprotein translocase subunit SecE|nr:preprotein translocase subunit SecE [Synergistaceae bacterium]